MFRFFKLFLRIVFDYIFVRIQFLSVISIILIPNKIRGNESVTVLSSENIKVFYNFFVQSNENVNEDFNNDLHYLNLNEDEKNTFKKKYSPIECNYNDLNWEVFLFKDTCLKVGDLYYLNFYDYRMALNDFLSNWLILIGADQKNDKYILRDSGIIDSTRKYFKYNQYHQGVLVEFGDLIVHTNGGFITQILARTNNDYSSNDSNVNYLIQNIDNVYSDSLVCNYMQETELLNSNRPEIQLKWVWNDLDSHYILTYSFNVISKYDSSEYQLSFSPENNKIFKSRIHHSCYNGSGNSYYEGHKYFTTEMVNGKYCTFDYKRGIYTYDYEGEFYNGRINQNGNYISKRYKPYFDSDNSWSKGKHIDAHWGLQIVYDYYKNGFGRLSYDNRSSPIYCIVNSISESNTEFGTWYNSTKVMSLGIGYPSPNGYTNGHMNLQTIAHEYGHAITENEVLYDRLSFESMALNEALSDIFSCAIRFKHSQYKNWELGSEITHDGKAIRSPQNPTNISLYGRISQPGPDCYQGKYYGARLGEFENGFISKNKLVKYKKGYHEASMIISHWFYLLVSGGTDTAHMPNKKDNYYYSLNAVDTTKVVKLVYDAITKWCPSKPDFRTFKSATIQAAISNNWSSSEMASLYTAWYGVNLGLKPSVPCSSTFILSNRNGVLADGSDAQQYGNNNDCKWLIAPTGASSITLKFKEFLLESNDRVYVYDGSNATDTLLLSATGTSLPSAVTSSGSSMLVRFTTNSTGVHEGWTAEYTSTTNSSFCQDRVILSASSGTFTDGSGSNSYNNNSRCSWIIAPPGADSIFLSFNSFSTEYGNDSLVIYCGDSLSGRKYGPFSGTSIPSNINIPTGEVLVKFNTNENTTGAGWSISYSSKGTVFCSGTTTLTANADTFTDGSNWNQNYFNNSNCRWLIQPSGAKSIKLAIDSLDLEPSSYDGKVFYDYINIYDGHSDTFPLLATIVGRTIPDDIVSTGGTVLVEFHSDSRTGGKGFQISYSSINSGYCHGTKNIKSEKGVINDGSDTAKYEKNADCRWLIRPDNASSIVLRFDMLSTDTLGDGIIIYDGGSINSPVLARFDGNVLPTDSIVSSYGEMLVRFISNDTITFWDSGFSCSYYSHINSSGPNGAIVGYEYWFNTDTIRNYINTPPIDNYFLKTNLSTDGLIPGLHTFNIRYLDRDGVWSSVLSDKFLKTHIETGVSNKITAYEHWFDNQDSIRALYAVQPNLNYSIDSNFQTDSLGPGLHRLNVRFKNGIGIWSSVLSEYFKKSINDTSVNKMSYFEYWYDTAYSIKKSENISPVVKSYYLDNTANAKMLNKGIHQIHMRFKTDGGIWTSTTNDTFFKRSIFILDSIKTLCANDSIKIHYSKQGGYDSANTIVVYLSDSSGSFASAIVLGSQNSFNVSDNDSIMCFIPSNIRRGSNYKIRIISSIESDTSLPTNNFVITEIPSLSIALSGASKFCLGDSVIISATNNLNYKYFWFKDSLPLNIALSDYVVYKSGIYKVKVIDGNGCHNFSKDTNVLVYPRTKVNFKVNNDTQCLNNNDFILLDSSKISSGTYTALWSFGDNSNSSKINPSKKYTNSGSFNITLITTSNFNCKDSLIKIVNVKYMPMCSFEVNDSIQCQKNHEFVFTDRTDSLTIPINRMWDFGNGSYSEYNVSHQSSFNPGEYKITLHVYTTEGCEDSVDRIIKLHEMPRLGFSVNKDSQCFKYNNFIYTDTSKGNVGYSRIWDIDNSLSTIDSSVNWRYINSGTKFVQLFIRTDNDCKDTSIRKVIIFAMPKSGFTVNDTEQCLKNNIFRFIDTTSKSFTSYSRIWNFGNGNSSSIDTPSINYFTPNKYNTELIIKTIDNCLDTSAISIIVYPDPIARFLIDSSNNCLNSNIIKLRNKSKISSGIYSVLWQFSDDSSSNSDSIIQKKFYNPGNYSIQLVAASSQGCRDTARTGVLIYPNPKSEFDILDSVQCLRNNSFTFLNTTAIQTGNLDFFWSFGDGDTSIRKNPVKSYKTIGSYDIKLISISSQKCSDTIESILTVYPQPIASFSINDSIQCLNGNKFEFYNTSSINYGAISSNWSFGDSITSDLFSLTYSYSHAGEFNISLEMISEFDCKDSATVKLKLLPNPEVAASIIGDSIMCEGDSIKLEAIGAQSYIWSNGFTGNSMFAKLSGYYFVTGLDSNNCANRSDTIQAIINPSPFKPSIIKIGKDSLRSSYLAGNQWFMNDSIISGALDQYYQYTKYGVYKVKYTDSNGCTANSDTVIVNYLVSIIEIENLDIINIYPNPTEGDLYIQFFRPYNGEIQLTDMLGEIVFEQYVDDEDLILISLNSIAKGVYCIRYNNRIYKFVKI